jgi:hypothetical protein
MAVKYRPEAVIDSAALSVPVKFSFRPALQRLPLCERGMTIARKRRQQVRPVRKQQGIANIEENYARCSHLSILPKPSRPDPPGPERTEAPRSQLKNR